MRGFVVVALACIAFAIIYLEGGCEPSTEGCSWDATTKTYSCPNER
jgi:hypothetical protein